MFKIINKVCAIVCLRLFFLMGSLYGLSPKDFYNDSENKEGFSLWLGVDKETVAEKPIISLPWHYSPFCGVLLLQSGFMERMRFCGNKKIGYFEADTTIEGVTFKKGARIYSSLIENE
ncbi:hypothetical protein FACS189472_14030 [Alphaproteobacteria bacterium]|nr:hypothetical protein FACS189472_14030 [Alphaproteobacteria bacterium]